MYLKYCQLFKGNKTTASDDCYNFGPCCIKLRNEYSTLGVMKQTHDFSYMFTMVLCSLVLTEFKITITNVIVL